MILPDKTKILDRLLPQQRHQKAGVQESLCGIPQVNKFQTAVDNYRIIILSVKHFNTIVCNGPRQENQIYLYPCENHFDVITSGSSFIGRGYWCLEYMKGYNEKEQHQKGMQTLFYRGLPGNHAESHQARMRY